MLQQQGLNIRDGDQAVQISVKREASSQSGSTFGTLTGMMVANYAERLTWITMSYFGLDTALKRCVHEWYLKVSSLTLRLESLIYC